MAAQTRIEPRRDAAGKPLPHTPPSGGFWRLDPDGGLTPLDESTALGAGLQWPADAKE